MKRILSVILALLLLSGLTACGQKPDSAPAQTTPPAQTHPAETEPAFTLPDLPMPDADAFHFTRQSFPRLDGSTSLVPMGQSIASVLLGESREDVSDLISFNRTTQSFRNLMDGYCDVVVAAEPQSIVFDEMNNAGFGYELETIAKEALVFVVNEGNGVDSLTTEQIRDIYAGKITNWSQLGGADLPIEAFQRNPSSGSQVMMEKLVMGGTPMMEAPETHVPSAMGELIQSVKSFDGSANAIGYTVFYYAKDMQMAKGLKILQVDGITPDADSIRQGEYPFVNGYYCCIPASAPEQSPARRLYRWLVSESGQTLLSMEGYVPVFETGHAPEGGTDVFTDFTRYVPNGGIPSKFTELPGGTPEYLKPAKNYGTLHAYTGSLLYANDAEYEYQSGSMKGFYSEDGTLVTQPSYSSIGMYRLGDSFVWIMDLPSEESAYRRSFASFDGSFVCNKEYGFISILTDWILCQPEYNSPEFDLYDRDLNLCLTQDAFQINGRTAIPYDYSNGKFACTVVLNENYENEDYLIDTQGQILYGPCSYISFSNDLTLVSDKDFNRTVLDGNGNALSIDGHDKIAYCYYLNDNFLSVNLLDNTYLLLDRNGNVFDWGFDFCGTLSQGNFYIVRGEERQYYSAEGKPLFDAPVSGGWEYSEVGNIFYRSGDGGYEFRNVKTGKTITVPYCQYCYPLNSGTGAPKVILIPCYNNDIGMDTLFAMDASMHMTQFNNAYVSTLFDSYTGKQYTALTDYTGSQTQRVLTDDFQTELFRANGDVYVENGLYTTTTQLGFTARRPDGSVLFCYPFYGLKSGD